ncbi:hypothetical protein CDLVIII_1925 [Clostridium sp. DL-VIII]|uniref:TolC family protein n=1 Tax=Clostridium sp. DL-VIII TaxID=641107 RepID=UPI00023B0143|nr:TolC family protein [Clostridium sp. DL-VIII]EHI98609.1 hypothetical protein CDLVIII_1925 [Clostridium sp. DL-VIII]
MRKNINKIIAFAIGVSVMSGSIIPVFAADSTTNPSTTTTTASNAASTTTAKSNVLTLDDAIKAAISISDTLALDEQKISYQDKINGINEDKDDFNDVSDDQEDYDNDTADETLNKLKQQRDFDEDSLTQKVTDQYNSLVTSQMQIDMATKKLAVDNKNLQDANLKQSLGIKTSIDIKTTELSIQKEQNDLTTNQNKLKDAQYAFQLLTGKDASQYTLEKDINFEPFKIDGSLDDYLDNIIDSYLKYSEELLQTSKDYYDKDYEKDNNITTDDLDQAKSDAEEATKPSKPSDSNTDVNAYQKYEEKLAAYNGAQSQYTNILAARLAYLNTKLNNYSNEVAISEEKKAFKEQLRSYYTNLQTYEDSINYCKKEIEINNEQLSNYKLKYDLGMITESDYNAQVVSTEQAEIDLRNAIIAYNQNEEYLQKPWIVLSSSK